MSAFQIVAGNGWVRSDVLRRGLTQRDLARALGVAVSLIRRIEQEDYGGIGVVALRKLAAALDVPATVLLTAAPADKPSADSDAMWRPLTSRQTHAIPGHPAWIA